MTTPALEPLPVLTTAEWRALPATEKNRLRALKQAHRAAGTAPGPAAPPDPNRSPFHTLDKRPLHLTGLYRGASCFIVLPGPSIKSLDLSLLNRRGVYAIGVNNSPAVFRPQAWIFVDPPEKFHNAIWTDPAILKFVHDKFLSHKIREKVNGQHRPLLLNSGKIATPPDMPGVVPILRSSYFDPEKWLNEPTIGWGNSARSSRRNKKPHELNVMFAVLKLAYVLGFRQVYLLGCDFHMDSERPYAFDEARHQGSINGNNHKYGKCSKMLAELKPHFDAAGFRVFNCNPTSGLTVFPHLPYLKAIEAATDHVPQDPLDTVGWYTKG